MQLLESLRRVVKMEKVEKALRVLYEDAAVEGSTVVWGFVIDGVLLECMIFFKSN